MPIETAGVKDALREKFRAMIGRFRDVIKCLMNPVIPRSLLILTLGIRLAFALEPTPRPDPARFTHEIAAFMKQEPEKGGIVFVGSSNIRLWPHLKEDFPGLPIVNRGFGGSLANDLIVYFDTVVARHEPKLIVAYAGGNDIEKKLTVQEVFDDCTKFLTMTHTRFPKARVILNSVKIAPRRALQIPQVNELNQRLQTWCAAKDWLRFLDSASYLADAQGLPIPSYYRTDDLHLNDSGYAKWQAILDPVLREEWEKVK